jgi:hypothetical protein
MFVLTGAVPQVRALDMSTTTIGGGDFNDAYLNIKVLPWVSLGTLKSLYHDAQRQLLLARGKRFERTLEVFRFVTREAGTYPEESDWRGLFNKWKEEHKNELKPFKQPRDIKQCYNRARETLLQHDYTEAQRKAKQPSSV